MNTEKILFSAPTAEDLSEFKWCESLWKKMNQKMCDAGNRKAKCPYKKKQL